MVSFAPEDQLLIQCSRTTLSQALIASASKLLHQTLDWDYIVEASIRHGVSPLIYHGLQLVTQAARLDELVPPSAKDALRQLYHGNCARNRRLYKVIGEIFGAFEQAGLPAMALKDVALARQVYPDPGLRPMGDIDILIRFQDYARVAACMARLGFVPLPHTDIPFTLKYAWGHHFCREADQIWVDMQWNVLQIEWDAYHEGSLDFDIDRMWRGASRLRVDAYDMLAPRPEDMLFHLCLHLEGHAYSELILFCDLVELLRHYEGQLDWQYLIDITTQYRVESSLYYALFLLDKLFQVPLPAFVLQTLKPTYFKAGLFGPLFGHLGGLHFSLDQIRLAVVPPSEPLRKFENVVRQQAVGSMQVYKELDGLVEAFARAGGTVAIFQGDGSERVFPDPSLDPFGEIRCLILERDLPHWRQALLARGFEPAISPSNGWQDTDEQRYLKKWTFASSDPSLAGRPVSLRLQMDIEPGSEHLPPPQHAGSSLKKRAALKLLKAKLGPRRPDQADFPACVRLIAFSAEDLLVYLGAQLGRPGQTRLFGLCNLIEFFEQYADALDWDNVIQTAQRYDVGGCLGQGLALGEQVLESHALSSPALAQLAGADLPRILEWARYDPDSLHDQAGFRDMFYYLVCLLSLEGCVDRFKYLARSRAGGALWLGLLSDMAAGLRKEQANPTEHVYWIEAGRDR